MSFLRSNHWLLALFIGFVLVYIAVQNVGYFDASDSWSRSKMMQTIVTTGQVHWTDPGQTEPRTCEQTAGPGLALLPFQAIGYLGHHIGLFDVALDSVLVRWALVGNVFYTALWMCVLAWLSVELGSTRIRAVGVSSIAGLATMIFPYSKSAQGENLVGLLMTLLVLQLLYCARAPKLRYPLGIGFLFGLLMTCKPELAVISPLVVVAVLAAYGSSWCPLSVLRRWKTLGLLALGTIPGAIIILLFDYLRYGKLLNADDASSFSLEAVRTYFSHPLWRGLYLQFFSPGKGVFWYCPVLFASLLLLGRFLKNQPRVMLLPYGWWIVMSCLYAVWFRPTGDTALGSRFQVSYLGFAVLPLLAMPAWEGLRGRLMRSWAGLCIAASAGLATLFCLVSFNIDYHRKLFAPDGHGDIEAQLLEMYYRLDYSLLLGFFQVLREGLLDMYFVRLNPLESALTILPEFWFLLAGGACGFGAAVWLAREQSTPHDTGFRRLALTQVPMICLVALGFLRVGDPGESGLRLRMTNADGQRHKTIVQAIEIDNMDDGREVYRVPTPLQMRWSGEVFCDVPGVYTFRVESNRPLELRMAKQQITTEPGDAVAEFHVLDAGWQSLKITCRETHMNDHFRVTMKAPADPEFRSLADVRTKH